MLKGKSWSGKSWSGKRSLAHDVLELAWFARRIPSWCARQ